MAAAIGDAVEGLAEAPVRPKIRDSEVAHDPIEEPAAVHDVPHVHHLEPDGLDPESRRPVRRGRNGPVREVDRDDVLRGDPRRDHAREEPRARPQVEEQFARLRVRGPEDPLRDGRELRGHVPVVRLRHAGVFVRQEEDDLLGIHVARHGGVRLNGSRSTPPSGCRLSLSKDNSTPRTSPL